MRTLRAAPVQTGVGHQRADGRIAGRVAVAVRRSLDRQPQHLGARGRRSQRRFGCSAQSGLDGRGALGSLRLGVLRQLVGGHHRGIRGGVGIHQRDELLAQRRRLAPAGCASRRRGPRSARARPSARRPSPPGPRPARQPTPPPIRRRAQACRPQRQPGIHRWSDHRVVWERNRHVAIILA